MARSQSPILIVTAVDQGQNRRKLTEAGVQLQIAGDDLRGNENSGAENGRLRKKIPGSSESQGGRRTLAASGGDWTRLSF